MILVLGMKLPGSKAHRSPELRNPKANQTINMSKVDVWAAGVLAFEMCGHSNPFDTIDALGYSEDQLPQLMYTCSRESTQAFPLPSGFTTLVNSLLIYDWKRRPSAKYSLSSAQQIFSRDGPVSSILFVVHTHTRTHARMHTHTHTHTHIHVWVSVFFLNTMSVSTSTR